jgi:cyclopropane fatty-acyl-phospholipid synthase-like methyltransferase
MLHFFKSNPTSDVLIDCVEQDMNAIEHATRVCRDHLGSIRFYRRNALRFQSDTAYDLIWSAGLFDYLEDKVFVFMLRKLKTLVASQGEIVVGNFSTTNPSRHYMQVVDWILHHRSPPTLRHLATEAGFPEDCISIGKEPLGVNLFLHINNHGEPI